MVIGPLHLLGYYFKRLDDRHKCRKLHRCPSLVKGFVVILSFAFFIVLFPLWMVMSIGLMFYLFHKKVKAFNTFKAKALFYMRHNKDVKV